MKVLRKLLILVSIVAVILMTLVAPSLAFQVQNPGSGGGGPGTAVQTGAADTPAAPETEEAPAPSKRRFRQIEAGPCNGSG